MRRFAGGLRHRGGDYGIPEGCDLPCRARAEVRGVRSHFRRHRGAPSVSRRRPKYFDNGCWTLAAVLLLPEAHQSPKASTHRWRSGACMDDLSLNQGDVARKSWVTYSSTLEGG